MPRIYTDEVDLIEQVLQDTGNAEFTAAEINYQMEESLKELGSYQKHENLCPVVFKIESRYGTVSATSTSNLTDTVKTQFVSGDATNEKIVHNTTDDTWATVASYTSTSVLALNADIFVSGDTYEIYNKRCYNKRQIYIGDVNDYLRIAKVEYPIGRPRNWTLINNNIIEIDVVYVGDSNSTLGTLESVDVLVWFAKPHILSQTVDLAGEALGAASAGATTFAVDGLGATVIIEEGNQFTIENHRSIYTTIGDQTTSANAATFTIYPALEAAVSDNDDVTFVSSTLLPDDEDILAEMVAARLCIYHAPKFFKAIGAMGPATSANYSSWGERRLAMVRQKLSRQAGARTAYLYPRS